MKYYIVRGIVGSGKSQVANYLASKHKGLRLSTDNVREEVNFEDSVQYNDAFRDDPPFRAQQALCYELMLAVAAAKHDGEQEKGHWYQLFRQNKTPDGKPEPVDCKMLLKGALHHANAYAKSHIPNLPRDFTLSLLPDERERALGYLENKVAVPANVVICEAVFNRREQLTRFFKVITPRPCLIDVSAPRAHIIAWLKKCEERGESKAGLPVFEALEPTWKTAKQLGHHAHEIYNNIRYDATDVEPEQMRDIIAAGIAKLTDESLLYFCCNDCHSGKRFG